jgi:hypothetical protein
MTGTIFWTLVVYIININMGDRYSPKILRINIFRYFINMSGNIFTEQLKSSLPNDIQDFIAKQNLQIIFKHDLPTLYNKNLREKSLDTSLTEKQSRVLKQQRSDKLDSILRSSCNPTFSKVEREQYLLQNSCKKYYDKKNKHHNDKEYPLKYLPGIGDTYFTDIMRDIELPTYDIVILANIEKSKKRIDQSIAAFLITEKFECKDADNLYTDIPALKLICVSSRNKNRYTSRLLIFLYLYALKQSNYKYGLLELAGSYCNLSGLCLYNKFGFREDLSIKTDDCFPEIGTLSMVADLDKITYANLEKALTSPGSDNVELPDSEPLCVKESNAKTPEEKQKQIEKKQGDVEVRMDNYDHILSLQNGNIHLDEFHDYFDKGKPAQLKIAIKNLSKYSKQGKHIIPTPKSAIPDYFVDDNSKQIEKILKRKGKEPVHKSRRRKREDDKAMVITKEPRNTRRKIEKDKKSKTDFKEKNKHFS